MVNILKVITDAQIMSSAVYPTAPYTGSLPTKTVKRGSEGSDVKAVQKFLNWCIKAGLKIDGSCGKKTVAAIKKYQKQYKLKVDGIFGSQSKSKAKKIIEKYALAPSLAPATWVEKANAWAKKIAADNTFHYKLWKANDEKTHYCPICKGYPVGKYHGWNCIGFAWAVWHHGGGLKNKCNCYVLSNGVGNSIYKAKTDAEALKIVQNHCGLKDIKVIRNKKGIPKSQWKAGDIALQFNGSTYVHTFYIPDSEHVIDSTGSNGKVANDKQIAVRSNKNYSAKIIIRYTGK